MKVPHRDSLIVRTADSLREAIAEGVLVRELPGVRQLSRDLHVSVPTVLGAVELLREEGLLQPRPGRKTLIVAPARLVAKEAPPPPGKVVILAFSRDWVTGCDFFNAVIRSLHERDLEVHVCECLHTDPRRMRKALREWVETHRAGCWLLMAPPLEAQRFFADRRLPCLINGLAHPGILIPDYEVDFSALYRHAVYHLQGQGHWRIALLLAGHSAQTNPESLATFRESVARKVPAGESWEPVVIYDDEMAHHQHLMQRLFRHRATAPTALVVARHRRLVATMLWLMSHGYRIPQDVSLICRDGINSFIGIYPMVTHYRRPRTGVDRLVRAILAILERRHVQPHRRVFVEMVPGQTVAAPRGLEPSNLIEHPSLVY